LLERIAAARRGMDLLDRKRQLLRREYDRLVLVAEERRRSWTDACVEAGRWSLRVAMLGGSGEIALVAGAVAGKAEVTLSWRNTMGVQHPDDARCALPEIMPPDIAAGTAALGPAATAYRRALELGVAVAVAEAARQRIERELHATQRRLRGIERRHMPALESALQALELQLDELEREDRVITRWAQRRQAVR
jgi:V/A-type H+-transporting ATPase subunit D